VYGVQPVPAACCNMLVVQLPFPDAQAVNKSGLWQQVKTEIVEVRASKQLLSGQSRACASQSMHQSSSRQVNQHKCVPHCSNMETVGIAWQWKLSV
jgi:hypothetical protein